MYKHFLITRFNLRFDAWETTKNDEAVLSNAWLQHRFELFESFCLPSVMNQTNQNFVWYIFFNTDTPSEYIERINCLSGKYNRIKPIFIDGYSCFYTSLLANIDADVSENDKYIITSRLDNDDAIHMNYINAIQNCFAMQKSCVVDIVNGYQLILEEGNNIVGMINGKFNPFVSLIESSLKPVTVMAKMHLDWEMAGESISIGDKRLWLMLIHQKNKDNIRCRTFKRINEFNQNEFGFDDVALPVKSLWVILVSNVSNKVIFYLVRFIDALFRRG